MTRAELEQIAREAAAQYGLPADVFLRLIQQESGFDPTAVSPKGAIGPAQLMPDTAKELNVDPRNVRENIFGGAKYLSQQLNRFGEMPLALAAYNAGPTRVARLGRIPNIPETQNYVKSILGSTDGQPLNAMRNDSMSMNPNAPQRTGLLGFMDMMRKPDEETGLTAMERFGAALDPLLLPEQRMGEQIRARGARRLQTQAKNKTIAELEKMAQGNPFAADLLSAVRAGAMSPADAYKALMSQRYDTSKDTIRSTQRFLNGTYYVVTDAGPKVYNPSGKLVTGDEAEQVLAEANKFEIENRALGVGLSEAQKLQQQYANEAFDKSEQLTSSIGNIDTAIAAIDSGAKRNVILNQLPDITSQSAQLTSALRRMGLDVVSSVTFGALSEAELNIAMATAYPPNATEQELRKFLVDRKNALIKLRKYTEDAAMFLGNPNNTRSDWMQIVRERRDQTAASSAGNPYMSMSLEELNDVYLRFNSLSEAQKNQFTEALRSKQR